MIKIIDVASKSNYSLATIISDTQCFVKEALIIMKRIIATISTLAIAMAFCLTPMITKAEAEVEAPEAEVIEAEAPAEAVEAITEEDALRIAMENVGYSQSAIKYPRVWTDTEGEAEIYKVEFYLGPVAFCYHIDMAGEIIDRYVKN